MGQIGDYFGSAALEDVESLEGTIDLLLGRLDKLDNDPYWRSRYEAITQEMQQRKAARG